MELLDMITTYVPIDDLSELSKVNRVFKSLCSDKCISLDLLEIQNHNNAVKRQHDRLERIYEDINSAYDINRLAYLNIDEELKNCTYDDYVEGYIVFYEGGSLSLF